MAEPANGVDVPVHADTPDPEVYFRENDGGEVDEQGQGDANVRNDYRDRGADMYPREIDDRDENREFRDREPELRDFRANPNEPSRFPINQLPGYAISATTIKPEPYNGRESWEEYISHFENCAELGRWSDADKVLLLSASLRGQARTFYISLTTVEKKSYYLLVKNLEQRFGNARHQNRWLSRFETRTRQPNESIATFGDDLRQMAQKAYSNLDCIAQEVLALNQLYKNISLEMKCRCIDKECRTVTEAVDLIERYEALLGENNDKKRGNIRQVAENKKYPSPTVRFENPTNNPSNDEIVKQLTDRVQKLEQGQGYSKRVCYNCNSPDHFYRNCPLNRKQTGQNQNMVQNQNWQRNTPYYQRQTNNGPRQNQGNENPSAQQAGARRN